MIYFCNNVTKIFDDFLIAYLLKCLHGVGKLKRQEIEFECQDKDGLKIICMAEDWKHIIEHTECIGQQGLIKHIIGNQIAYIRTRMQKIEEFSISCVYCHRPGVLVT